MINSGNFLQAHAINLSFGGTIAPVSQNVDGSYASSALSQDNINLYQRELQKVLSNTEHGKFVEAEYSMLSSSPARHDRAFKFKTDDATHVNCNVRVEYDEFESDPIENSDDRGGGTISLYLHRDTEETKRFQKNDHYASQFLNYDINSQSRLVLRDRDTIIGWNLYGHSDEEIKIATQKIDDRDLHDFYLSLIAQAAISIFEPIDSKSGQKISSQRLIELLFKNNLIDYRHSEGEKYLDFDRMIEGVRFGIDIPEAETINTSVRNLMFGAQISIDRPKPGSTLFDRDEAIALPQIELRHKFNFDSATPEEQFAPEAMVAAFYAMFGDVPAVVRSLTKRRF